MTSMDKVDESISHGYCMMSLFQGLSAFHWALILGHIDIISIMTSLNEKLLHNCDENGRSPRQICTRVRPKIQVRVNAF